MRGAMILGLGLALGVSPAAAAVGDWRLNEVVTAGANGDPAVRFVELYTAADACWFPSTRIDAYDEGGHPIGSVAPFASTTCFAADSYLVLATTQAGAAFAFTPDVTMVPPLPAAAGQLCFASSATNYDCVRWGAVSTPIHDFLGATDDTSAASPPGGIALARTQVTHVVSADWALMTPTPRGPNDGTVWIPPDARPIDAAVVDAALSDAGPPDAVVDARPRPDAVPFADAKDHRYLDLDPGGGACVCRSTRGGAGSGLPVAAAVALVMVRRRRRVAGRRVRPDTASW